MIKGTAGNGYISRNPSWFDPSQDWTKSFYLRLSGVPTGATVSWLFGAINYSGNYIIIGNDPFASANIALSTFVGATFTETTPVAFSTLTNYYVSARYTSSTHLLELLRDGVVIASITSDLTTFGAQTSEAHLNDGGADDNKISIAYERLHQRALTNAEIITEMASITVVDDTDLLSDCPLQTSIDLTDHNGNARQFYATGTVTTDTTDPLLAIVAGPPPNVSPATAITITTASAYFQNTITGTTATTVWHKTTCSETGFWGAAAFGDLVTYQPAITVYEGLSNANSNTALLAIIGGANLPIQFPVTSGNDYYFKSTRNGAVTPAVLQVSILKALNLPVPISSIAVSDDSAGFPVAFLDSTTGYPIKFMSLDSAGEGGANLANGKVVVGKNTNNKPNLYASNLGLITEINLAGYDKITSNSIDKFGIANGTLFRLVDESGNIEATVYTPTGGVFGAGLNVTFSKIYYYSTNGANVPIKVWNLVTNLAEANLVAGVANYNQNKDAVIVLQDGNILVLRIKNTVTRNTTAKIYDTAGVELHSYDLGGAVASNGDNRVFTAVNDPVSFWVWLKDVSATGFSTFKNIKVSDGSTLASFTAVQYESALYAGAATNTPVRFGHSESCPAWTTRSAINPIVVAASGLYYIDDGRFSGSGVRKPNDTYWVDTTVGTTTSVAIPNPFVEGYAAGDE